MIAHEYARETFWKVICAETISRLDAYFFCFVMTYETFDSVDCPHQSSKSRRDSHRVYDHFVVPLDGDSFVGNGLIDHLRDWIHFVYS
jgi:hypothetical protein